MRKALKLGLLICLLLIAVNLASAATLHGTVYDYSLKKVDNAFVTLGAEKDITESGEYYFEVGLGTYNISARFYDEEGKLVSSVTESIDITEEKAYVFDLVLFESIAEEELLFLETEQVLTDVEPTFLELKVKEGFYWIGVVILFVFLALVYVWMKRMKKIETKVKEVKEDRKKKEMIVKGEAEKVLEFIKKQERTTQKDIRNEFPSSEAKISLVLTELETKGKIRKIKKGRGNIIIYNE
ncbi:hypothetical protein KY326_02430 [Candidatus Woesearchaeota archaeon]|nr:hypothetical protein [Candidatus Woesearchaeota archaeon]